MSAGVIAASYVAIGGGCTTIPLSSMELVTMPGHVDPAAVYNSGLNTISVNPADDTSVAFSAPTFVLDPTKYYEVKLTRTHDAVGSDGVLLIGDPWAIENQFFLQSIDESAPDWVEDGLQVHLVGPGIASWDTAVAYDADFSGLRLAFAGSTDTVVSNVEVCEATDVDFTWHTLDLSEANFYTSGTDQMGEYNAGVIRRVPANNIAARFFIPEADAILTTDGSRIYEFEMTIASDNAHPYAEFTYLYTMPYSLQEYWDVTDVTYVAELFRVGSTNVYTGSFQISAAGGDLGILFFPQYGWGAYNITQIRYRRTS